MVVGYCNSNIVVDERDFSISRPETIFSTVSFVKKNRVRARSQNPDSRPTAFQIISPDSLNSLKSSHIFLEHHKLIEVYRIQKCACDNNLDQIAGDVKKSVILGYFCTNVPNFNSKMDDLLLKN